MSRAPAWLQQPPSKALAFSIHMTLSLLAFSALVLMMVLFWFPGELFLVDGGWQGLKLVAMVDLVLGPALTLILYKPGKPKVMLDLSVIAAIQIGALAYGFYTTHAQRTVAVVFAENSFSTISARDHREANKELLELKQTPGTIEPGSVLNIPILMTPEPENLGEHLAERLNGYPELRERSDLYIPIAEGRAHMRSGQQSIETLEKYGILEAVNTASGKKALVSGEIEAYTYKTRYSSGIALFDPAAMKIVDFIPVVDKPEQNKTLAVSE